ncbi:ABC transporter ATP-binding protein [Natranaerobius thermophilus]|uniref:Oligopeptide/dipeptide ABC transporter, ATPase subunit n=1 Tax=Natranaerobius thermophilus (strain ATCC BAA-1301 / DSM 18059 / JW/NM-WN-LF) TaxID=457570 RepID=B2A5R3_NATTJ|nr:ABC transporter ATP-binding protein [Natranaerobius thermophilus]ACB84076.1 oligopeptide/dipeptide ABC transporter, ATPase subunit [Natranaerobius thermophilus JW/NM-WN-LF]
MSDTLLEVKGLQTYFYTEDGTVKAVDGVDFHVNRGEILGIVGESGCGKSVSNMSILRLIQDPPGKIVGGEINFEGTNLLELPENKMRNIRGNDIAMIFQEPMTSLNPVFTVGDQIMEALLLHRNMSMEEARNHAVEMLKTVGIPRANEAIDEYPHQFSGGMRQRAMIAMALSCNPSLLLADEPTTALDVTIQKQILELIKDMKEQYDTGITLITHDLGVIADMADRVVVMYAGKVVEQADIFEIFDKPLHPYTSGLHESIPTMDTEAERLKVIRGVVPNPLTMPEGCPFHPRCDHEMTKCREKMPPLMDLNGRQVRCWLYSEDKEVG